MNTHRTPAMSELARVSGLAHEISTAAYTALCLMHHHHPGADFHICEVTRRLRYLASTLGYQLARQPRTVKHPDYTTEVDMNHAAMLVGIDYTYEPGQPDIGPTMNFPGEPGYGPTANIGAIYWRADETAPWREADDSLAALIVASFGGDKALEDELITDAEAQAEADACDRADAMRDIMMERVG